MLYRMPLRAVFYREGGSWIAHCLELDLVGHGPTQQDALKLLTEAIGAQISASAKLGNPRNLFHPAEGRIFAMYAAGRDVVKGELHFQVPEEWPEEVEIEDMQYREFDAADAGGPFAVRT